jgi:uncharacterized protein YbjT (DUF2867 family)
MITIMGATGHVGRQVAYHLIENGERVRLMARSVDDLKKMVGRKAQAMAGDALDTEFLVQAFTGSDGAFVMIPPNPKATDFLAYADRIGASIARALQLGAVRYIVNLSSIGAELTHGTGPITALHYQEERLNAIPGVNVVHLRAGYFMENLLMNFEMIRSRGILGSALKSELKIPMIATRDIAAVASELLKKRTFSGSSVRYLLGSADLSLNEAAVTLGIKIGKPNLRSITFPYAEAEQGLITAGLSPDMSRRYIEMSRAFNDGRIRTPRTAESTTNTSFEEFCNTVVVPLYHRQKAA